MGQLRSAVRQGTLATLPLEFALTAPRRHTLTAVSRLSGVPAPYLRSVLMAIGHPNPRPRERAFTDEDLRAAQALGVFLKAGLPRDELLEVLRVVGQSLAQIASVTRRFVGDAMLRAGDSEHELSMRYVTAVEQLLPELAPLLERQLRVHLREQATRDVIGRSEREAGEISQTRDVAVCFVDLSGFTRLGAKLSPEEMGRLATRMAIHCYEVARAPVELIKTIGDGAMFVSNDAATLLRAICELTERIEQEGPEMPTLRAGLAYGPAVFRLGDWFGATVNRASRIADLAKPHTVLADEPLREQAGDAFQWKRTRRRNLKDIERFVTLHRLVGTTPPARAKRG